MSKPFMFGVLVILCGLLYATSFALRKQTEPPPPPQAAAAVKSPAEQEKMKQMMKEKMAQEDKSHKLMEARMKADAEELRKHPMKHPEPSKMNLSANWFKERPDGAVGIEKEIKERELGAKEAAAREAARKNEKSPPEEKSRTSRMAPLEPPAAK
jgi:hypothetical protein